MFVDEVAIEVYGGPGGDGCLAFRREKYVEMGGPFGGSGGRGSNIIFKVDEGLKTLIDFRYNRLIKGTKGNNGLGKGKQGANATDVIVRIPPGTTIIDEETNLIVADLTKKDDEIIIAYGGKGGRGNIALATTRNPAPNYAENGEPGEYRKLKLELKLLADVGLVGMPSVGKSTIISMISAAKPKIAAYHFTTLTPNLGVVRAGSRSFVVADLPGLIKGASLGEGLGEKFLKHVERTRIIGHVIDMSAYEGRDPYEDYVTINEELKAFNPKILDKPQIIIANKSDLPNFEENLVEFKKKIDLPIFPVSAAKNEGLDKVVNKLADMLEEIESIPIYEEKQYESHVLYKFKKEEPFTIIKENDIWIIKGEQVEKMLRMTKFNSPEATLRFAHKLRRLGIDEKLAELGAEDGDSVCILDYEFEFHS